MNLVQNGLVLSFARLTNYVLMLVTPLFLVRMLDVETYGKYREFLLYSMVLASILGLAIKDNLIYSIPRHPEKTPQAASQTIAMLLITTLSGLAIFFLGQSFFMSRASFDFTWPLILYVFFFLNFDILENYWIARQQPKYVLAYTSTRTLVRVLIVLITTYLTQDLLTILYAIITFEALKCLFCLATLSRIGAITVNGDKTLFKDQWQFIVPLSGAGLLYFVNEKAGHLFISTALGASALAVYTIGTYQLPITTIIRSAVADTLFPEMVRYAKEGSEKGLDLWKDATMYYCLLVFPVFIALFMFAEQFVTTLFTAKYAAAVGVFQIALFVMLRQCFEMGTPLRAVNSNKPLLLGNLAAIVVHLPLLYLLTRQIGIEGAAIAWITADMLVALFLARAIMKRYGLSLRQFARWRQIGLFAVAAIAATPPLFIPMVFPVAGLWDEIGVGLAYLGLYVFVVRLLGIKEADHAITSILGALFKRAKIRGA